jgi:integrase
MTTDQINITTNKINFTKRILDSLPLAEPGKRKEYYDDQNRNLMIRVSSNAKSFYVRRKIQGASQRILIGRYPDLSVEQARKKAAMILAEIAHGNNPQEIKRLEKEEPTIEEVFNNYMEGHVKLRCVRAKDMEADFRRYFTDWRYRRYSSVMKVDAQSKVNQLSKKHGHCAVNHAISLIKAAINWNIRHGYISGDNPWNSIKLFKVRARERFLLPNEIECFFKAVNKLSNTDVRDYIFLSLLTGARRGNILAMRWDQIDFDLCVWRIPLTKNGESHTVPITKAALQILQIRHANKQDVWVFPGKEPGQHLVEIKRVWQKIRNETGMHDLRLHDLRRTLGSYMAIGNQSLQIIGKALGHKSTQATQIYARLTQDPVRKAMEQAQEDMLAAAGLTSSLDNVVKLSLNVEQLKSLS